MDLKSYYRRIREVEAGIPEDQAVVVSRATAEGGREGALTEAPRAVAARLVVQGAADLATPEQAREFRQRLRARQAEEEARRAAARIQVNIISEADARALAGGPANDRAAERRRRGPVTSDK
jgi:hypothetical protein